MALPLRVAKGFMPTVSIIMPAFQAEASLRAAIASMSNQTFADWELVVVNDGSTDATLALANECAAKDPRIRVFRQANLGASAARNTGLREAKGEWIGFLDADDWFAPSFLQSLLDIRTAHPEVGVVYCDFALVDANNKLQEEQRVPDLSDPFGALARNCVLSVHCALTRADILRAAGTFDEALAINEDWDLWQRIARTGAQFRGIREILAFYVTRPNSLSRRKVEALASDGVTVIERMFAADPRVPSSDLRYANGLPLEDRLTMLLDWIIMCAGNAVALDLDPVAFLELVPDIGDAFLYPEDAAGSMTGAMAFARCVEVTALAKDWAVLGPRVKLFWERLAQKLGRERPVDMAQACQLRLIFGPDKWLAQFHSSAIFACKIDIAETLHAIDPGACDIVLADVFDGSQPFGLVAIPAAATLPPSVIADAIRKTAPYWQHRRQVIRSMAPKKLAGLAWHAGRELTRSRGWGVKTMAARPQTTVGSLKQRSRAALVLGLGKMVDAQMSYAPADTAAWDLALSKFEAEAKIAIADVPEAAPVERPAQEWNNDVEVNSVAYWDQVFETENPWAYDSPYEQRKYEQTLDLIPRDKPRRAIELACAEGHFTAQLAAVVDDLLATDISRTAIGRAAARCRASGHEHVKFDQLDFFNNPLPGMFDLIVCSEVLYEAGTREKLDQIARNIATHLTPDGVLVTAHIIEVTEERDRSGFDWGGVFGAKSITEALLATGELQLEAEIECELYRVQRYRRTQTLVVKDVRQEEMGSAPAREYAFHVVWGGTKATWSEVEHERALAVPVLMYHRIAEADDGPQSLAQYRVAPAMFEAQMRWLRQNGYHGITPDEWLCAIRERRAIAGRPVMLTFDDGYRDFATAAWPILGKFGIPATVAIVTDHIGGAAQWDRRFGEPAPLMNWDEVAQVAREGAIIASHSASHSPVNALTGHELYREAIQSREAIRKSTGISPETVIYPYGIEDMAACRAFEHAGYKIGFGTRSGVATMLDDPMRLPRVDVNGLEGLDEFIANVTQMDLQTGRKWQSSLA